MKIDAHGRRQLLFVVLGVLLTDLLLTSCGSDPRVPSGSPSDSGADAARASADAAAAADSSQDASTLRDATTGPVRSMDSGSDASDDDAGFDTVGQCLATSQLFDTLHQPADIIIAVDTSASMFEEIGFVREHLNAFSKQIDDSGVDAHVILIATAGDPDATPSMACQTMPWLPECFGPLSVCIDTPLGSGACPADSNLPAYSHLDQTVGSTDMLAIFISAYASYEPHLRRDSVKTFVAITDDDAAESASTFSAAVAALAPGDASMWADWKYSGIFCATQCAAAAAIGTVHDALVTQTGGAKGDLCLQDFEPVFDALAANVVDSAELSCAWDLPTPPSGTSFEASKLNVKLTVDSDAALLGRVASAADCRAKGGWHYDSEATPTQVLACPATCTRMRAATKVRARALFGCTSVP